MYVWIVFYLIVFLEGKLKGIPCLGFSVSVPAARLTLDPLFVTQRPFCFYATTVLINAFALIVLKALVFEPLE